MAEMAMDKVCVEHCPVSNKLLHVGSRDMVSVQLRVRQHMLNAFFPQLLKTYLIKGIHITISSDNPSMYNTDLLAFDTAYVRRIVYSRKVGSDSWCTSRLVLLDLAATRLTCKNSSKFKTMPSGTVELPSA